MNDRSRRDFLKMSAATALATAASHSFARGEVSAAQSASPESAKPLELFGYGEIELLDGPLKQQFDANHAFFLARDEDMLLKPFRDRAGLPAPGEDMGGWYDNSPEFDPHGTFHQNPGETRKWRTTPPLM